MLTESIDVLLARGTEALSLELGGRKPLEQKLLVALKKKVFQSLRGDEMRM